MRKIAKPYLLIAERGKRKFLGKFKEVSKTRIFGSKVMQKRVMNRT